jgi:hypothetical protein
MGSRRAFGEYLSGAFRREPVAAEPSGSDAWEELRREITRSRRFGHEFALVRLALNGRSVSTAPEVGALVRSIDRAWVHDHSVYLLLPESTRDAADTVIGRMRREVSEALRDEDVSVAVFPEDGLTSGALLRSLRNRLTRPEAAPVEIERPVMVTETAALHASGR